MKKVGIVTYGSMLPEIVNEAQTCIAGELGMRCSVAHAPRDMGFAFDAARRQFNSILLLKDVVGRRTPGAFRVIAIAEGDLFLPMLSFVFGQAQVDGRAAVVSVARLRQEFYGLPPNRELLLARFRKEVLHELGHTLSLLHCTDGKCVMSLATSIWHVDAKADRFCVSCRHVIDEKLRFEMEEEDETPLEDSGRRR